MMEEGGLDPAVVAVALIVPILLGIIQGLRERIVVFRDFNDLTLCFALLAVPLLLLYVGTVIEVGGSPVWLAFVGLIASGLLAVIVRRSWLDNRSVFATALTLVTKIPLGLLFIVALVNMVAPTGRTAAARSGARQLAFLGLLLLMPLVVGLTRNREGLTRFRVPSLS